MSDQAVRIDRFEYKSLFMIGNEVERDKNNIVFRNEDIDRNRTSMNFSFKETGSNMVRKFKQVCKDLNVTNAGKIKNSSPAFEGMIITANQEFFKNMGFVPGTEPPQKVKEFFEESYKFALEKIGFKGTDKNILSAVVHYDETTPHLQLYYVPIVDSWKVKVFQRDSEGKIIYKNGQGVYARDANGKMIYEYVKESKDRRIIRDEFWKQRGGQNSYRILQDSFYEKVSKKYNLGRGTIGSDAKHTTKKEWKENKEIMAYDKVYFDEEAYVKKRTMEILEKGEYVIRGKTVKLKDIKPADIDYLELDLVDAGIVKNRYLYVEKKLYEKHPKVKKENFLKWERRAKIRYIMSKFPILRTLYNKSADEYDRKIKSESLNSDKLSEHKKEKYYGR